MGLLKFLFSGTSSNYSDVERYFTAIDIKKVVSGIKLKNLNSEEEGIVEEAIISRRGSDDKISLRQIDKTLRELKQAKKISEFDQKELMKLFINYFSNLDKQ